MQVNGSSPSGNFWAGATLNLEGRYNGVLTNAGARINLTGNLSCNPGSPFYSGPGEFHLGGNTLSITGAAPFKNGGTLYLENGTVDGNVVNSCRPISNLDTVLAGTISGARTITGNLPNTFGREIIVGGNTQI